ncbi:MAG: SBBP repeat-containing protein [Bacteroidetes bacterium]|nr:SBBP repeat-containing protein [Bacteroidota bacterium]
MRKNYIFITAIQLLIVLECLIPNNSLAGIEKTSPEQKEQMQNSLRNNPVQFLENKGQMVDMNGKPVPFVLFKAEAPGVNLFITEKGLTYMFFEPEDASTPISIRENEEEETKIKWSRIDLELGGASIKKENIVTEGKSNYFNQYFLGHCPNGITEVHSYEKITIKNVYSNIDWVFYNSNKTGFKYDFIVHPGADPNNIKLLYRSKNQLNIDEQGNIQIKTSYGRLTENAPVSYIQETKENIASHFIKTKVITCNTSDKGEGYETQIAFNLQLSNFQTIVIDPQLVWGTFYGGNLIEGPMSVAIDNTGNLFVTGYTASIDFPVQNAGTYFDGINTGDNDVFILKFSNSVMLIWATFYGGSGNEWGSAIATDPNGNVFVTGFIFKNSLNFPTCNGTACCVTCPMAYLQGAFAGGNYDMFMLKFSNSGNRLWATYYGGDSDDLAFGIATDSQGNVFVTGQAGYATFPVFDSGNYFQTNLNAADAFILKFSNSGTRLWGTYYGGPGNLVTGMKEIGYAIAVDVNDNVFVTGETSSKSFPICNGASCCGACPSGYFKGVKPGSDKDAFILKFDNSGNRLWATYYGGIYDDIGKSIATDGNGNVFVTGLTSIAAGAFPLQDAGTYFDNTLGGTYDAFILKFDNIGNRLWATLYGGSGDEYASLDWSKSSHDNITIDKCGNVYVSFETTSTDITCKAMCNGGYFDNVRGGVDDQFLIRFSNTGILQWASYFGGNGSDFRAPIAVDNSSNLFVSGEWTSTSGFGSVTINEATYPLSNSLIGYYDGTTNGFDDGFLAKFTPMSFTQSQINSTSCAPCNGTATINLNCGEPSYNYTWSNGSSILNSTNASNTISGLCAGTYTVTATSSCNQSQTASFTISGTVCGGITASVNSATKCAGATSCPTLTAAGAGGTAPYTYTWSPGTNLSASTGASVNACPTATTTYTVTVKDNTGATATSTALVTVDPVVFVSISPTNINCSGASTGSATAAGGSGTPAYTYSWSNLVSGATVSGLGAGSYTVTVTDSKGCTSTSTTTIVAPPALTGQFTKGTATCAGCGCKEWLMVNAVGGTSPYTYSWPDGYSNRYKNQLCPGTHTINIKDKNGCGVNVNISSP